MLTVTCRQASLVIALLAVLTACGGGSKKQKIRKLSQAQAKSFKWDEKSTTIDSGVKGKPCLNVATISAKLAAREELVTIHTFDLDIVNSTSAKQKANFFFRHSDRYAPTLVSQSGKEVLQVSPMDELLKNVVQTKCDTVQFVRSGTPIEFKVLSFGANHLVMAHPQLDETRTYMLSDKGTLLFSQTLPEKVPACGDAAEFYGKIRRTFAIDPNAELGRLVIARNLARLFKDFVADAKDMEQADPKAKSEKKGETQGRAVAGDRVGLKAARYIHVLDLVRHRYESKLKDLNCAKVP